jgi:hypothetical protein
MKLTALSTTDHAGTLTLHSILPNFLPLPRSVVVALFATSRPPVIPSAGRTAQPNVSRASSANSVGE